jgi:serine protease Do
VRINRRLLVPGLGLLAVALVLRWIASAASATDPPLLITLPQPRFRNGEETLRAFAPLSRASRNSIVKFNVDGETVALGAVVDPGGLVLTKASEIKTGKLTCWLASDHEVPAELLAVDEDEDVALVRVHSLDLKPVSWGVGEVSLGQWAITPGIAETPHAVGIISALPRRIRPRRAFIGVQFDLNSPVPKVQTLLPGFSAEKAGVKPGDILAAVNGASVTNREQVVNILREFRQGQTVQLRLERDGKPLDLEVTMMPPESAWAGLAFDPHHEENWLAGGVSQRAEGFERVIEHDTVLQPWLCGGPLLNLDGKAIGLNIARAGRVTTYAIPAGLAQQIFQTLKSKQQPSRPDHPRPKDQG